MAPCRKKYDTHNYSRDRDHITLHTVFFLYWLSMALIKFPFIFALWFPNIFWHLYTSSNSQTRNKIVSFLLKFSIFDDTSFENIYMYYTINGPKLHLYFCTSISEHLLTLAPALILKHKKNRFYIFNWKFQSLTILILNIDIIYRDMHTAVVA